MAKNKVQFQKGISALQFHEQYGTEEQCREVLFKWRWPDGFRCPHCGNVTYCEIMQRKVYQCNRCHHQTSLIAGTIFQSTKLPLRVWFLAIYHLTQGKRGISSLELGRLLGVSQNTAWKIQHKLMQVMLERDNQKQFSGRIELDDAYLGGERRGGKRGRGAPGKTPFVAAVETTNEGEPIRVKFSRVVGFRKTEIEGWSKKHLYPGSTVVSDGLACFRGVTEAGCKHLPIKTGSGPDSVKLKAFQSVNKALGNLKTKLRGTYHFVSQKHVPRYLAQFQYRYNRRYKLEDMIPRLIWVALRTPPMPYRLLKIAEVRW
jgi:hypothetical protein